MFMKKATKSGMAFLWVKLCLICLTWNLSVKKFLFSKCEVSLALLHVADKFIIIINDFKTKWNGSFEWFQIQKEFTTLFEEMSPQPLVKCLQKFILHNYCMGKKTWQPFHQLCAKIVIVGSNQWVKNHHFHLNCPHFGE